MSDSDEFVGPQFISNESHHFSPPTHKHDDYPDLSLYKEVSLKHSKKPISSISIDNQGYRMASGCLSGQIKLWEFHGMSQNLDAFRHLEHQDLQPIVSTSYNLSNSHLLVANSGRQIKVHTRDGNFVFETPKGYTYLSDLSHTNGHIASVTSAMFNPFDDNTFMSSSLDSSVRMWNIEKIDKHQSIYKLRDTKNGQRLPVDHSSYSTNAKLIAVGLENGTMMIYDTKLSTINSAIVVYKNLHDESCGINSLSFSADDQLICSRSMDGTCKFIDMRNPSTILKTINNLPAKYKSVNASFNPSSRYILTTYCDSKPKKMKISNQSSDPSGLVIIDIINDFEFAAKLTFDSKLPTFSTWSKRLDQIFIGFSDGSFSGFYDSDIYMNHQDQSADDLIKKPRVGLALVSSQSSYINDSINDNSNFFSTAFDNVYDRPKSEYSKLLKVRKDPKLSHAPDLPLTKGTGGRIVQPQSQLSKQYIELAQKAKLKSAKNIREALLSHEEETKNNPQYTQIFFKGKDKLQD